MKMRTKGGDEPKKISKLQQSQNENVNWWNKFTEDQKIAMGLRPRYYVPTDFKKTPEEKEILRKRKIKYKLSQNTK